MGPGPAGGRGHPVSQAGSLGHGPVTTPHQTTEEQPAWDLPLRPNAVEVISVNHRLGSSCSGVLTVDQPPQQQPISRETAKLTLE